MIARLLLAISIVHVFVCADDLPPPNYAQNNLPNTSFSCDGKASGGYYADPEAGCQVFHVCVRAGPDEVTFYSYSYLIQSKISIKFRDENIIVYC